MTAPGRLGMEDRGSSSRPLAGARRRNWGRVPLHVEPLEERSLLNATVDWQLVDTRPFTTTEVMAGIGAAQPLAELAAAAAAPGAGLAGLVDVAASQVLFRQGGTATVQIALRAGADPRTALRQLQLLPSVRWAAPNFIYNRETDPRDFIPNDPQVEQQYHHARMQNYDAWGYKWFGDTSIVIAVTDDGVDMYHDDLRDNIWIHQSEIPLSRLENLTDVDADTLITFRDLQDPVNQGPFKVNDVNGDGHYDARDILAPMQQSGGQDLGGGGWANGVDEEANAYVDDLVGWNTTSQNNNNPQPQGGNSHGTHVAGIVAAVAHNGTGVAGTAGNVLIMPIRFYGTGSWTSAIVARSYAYGADNGARIITTSYNVDSMSSDPTFIAGVEYMYSLGVLHFNSAGNNNTGTGARQRIDASLYVCSTNVTDTRSSFSNYGYGVDLCTPGQDILSTLPNNRYGPNSGTSMASPNAAGVAALIWSVHSEWTREQIAAQLLGSCDNIDAQNPNYAGFLGCGRANSFRGLTDFVDAPRFKRVNGLPVEGGSTPGPVRTFQVDLANVFAGATVDDAANWELREAGADAEFDTGDDLLIPFTYGTTMGTPYRIGTNRLTFTLAGNLPPGSYRFRAFSGDAMTGQGLVDPFNQPLDGDGDGVGGDHFDRHFTLLGSGFGGRGIRGSAAALTAVLTPADRIAVVLPSPLLPLFTRTPEDITPVAAKPAAQQTGASGRPVAYQVASLWTLDLDDWLCPT